MHNLNLCSLYSGLREEARLDRAAFVQDQAQAAECFKPKSAGKWLADLAGLARMRLSRMGVTEVFGNDSSEAWCTFSQPSKFFSFRRDGVTGRLAAAVWIQG